MRSGPMPKKTTCWKVSFSRLENYSAKGYQVNLYSDFAPLPLEFIIKEKERFVLNGGLSLNMMVLGMVEYQHFQFHYHRIRLLAGQFTLKTITMNYLYIG